MTSTQGGGIPKAEDSTDKLRDCDSDKGERVWNPRNFVDIIEVSPHAAASRRLVYDRNRFSSFGRNQNTAMKKSPNSESEPESTAEQSSFGQITPFRPKI